MVFDYDQIIIQEGEFTCDEVFIVALCRLINSSIKIIISNDMAKHLKNASNIFEKPYVCTRHGDTFHAFWSSYGERLCKTKGAYEKIRDGFAYVLSSELDDKNLLVWSIEEMNTLPDTKETTYIAFHRAVVVASMILYSQIQKANYDMQDK